MTEAGGVVIASQLNAQVNARAQLCCVGLGPYADGKAWARPVTGNNAGVLYRWTPGANTGYLIVRTSATLAQIRRVAGGATQAVLGSITIAAGDTIGLEGDGTTIYPLRNGVRDGAGYVDATYATGYCGICFTSLTSSLDDFHGERVVLVPP